MTKEQGNQLKALGALAVIASHVGYFILRDNNFLFPFSNFAGVAVDLFFFLSAYGLAVSIENNGNHGTKIPIASFYKKRLLKIIPLVWIALTLFFTLDFLVYAKSYGFFYMLRSYFLIFPHADLFADIDSPLWYITPLFAYYLVFPFLFRKGKAFLSAPLFVFFGYVLTKFSFIDIHFTLHYLAFPLGIFVACFSTDFARWCPSSRVAVSSLLFIALAYGSIHSGVGTDYEQYISLLLMLALVAFFLISNLQLRLLSFVGAFSFELYLFHWPFLSRFDVLGLFRVYPWIWLISWMCVLLSASTLLRKVL